MNTWSLPLTRMSEILRVAQQRLERPQAEDLVQKVGLDLLLLVHS